MQWDTTFQGDPGEAHDVVYNPVGEVWCGPRDEDGVVVDHAVKGFGVNFEGERVDGDVMDFDAEVGAGFVECGVDCDGDDPGFIKSTTTTF